MLATNRLRTLPSALATATALRELRLEHNRISVSIPKLKATIGRMPHLTQLVWGPQLEHASGGAAGMDALRRYLANSRLRLQVEVIGEPGGSGVAQLMGLFAAQHLDVEALAGMGIQVIRF
jgi:hypothetical protein